MMSIKNTMRLLSLLLVLSLLVGFLPLGSVSATEQIPEIPANMTRVVFVNSEATGTGDGSTPENAYTSLESAFAALDGADTVIDTSDAVIVISGTVNVTASYNPTGFDHAHTGTYYITSKYGDYDYTQTASVVFSGGERINMNFFGKTFWSNVTLKTVATEVVLYSYTGLTFGAGVSTVMEENGTISVQAGMTHNHLTDGANVINVAIYSGNLTSVTASTDIPSGSTVAGLTHWGIALPLVITVGGSANIETVAVGNKGLSGNVTVNMTGGNVKNLYVNGLDGTWINGYLVMNLSSGTVEYMGDCPDTTTSQISGDVTVNVSGSFVDASGNYGGWGTGTTVAGTKTLNLNGYTGTLTKDAFANYTQTNIKGSSNITYVAELGAGAAVTVENGSTLNLLNNEETDGLNITNNGTVSYGASVYLDQTNGLDTNAGTKDAPVKTMEKAYELLPYGGVINVVGTYTYTYSGASTNLLVLTMPTSEGKIYITSADPTNPSTLSFETATKTNVQFLSPVEITNIHWDYDHIGTNGKKGNMNVYSGPSLTIGNGVATNCTGCNGVGTGCIAIRGGWYYNDAAPAVTGDDYSSRNIEITVNSGDWSYINGGHEGGNTANYAPVGNVVTNIGGTANIKQRIQLAGSNGGSIHGDSTLNVTGGIVAEVVLIGHGKSETYPAVIHGNAIINVTGGEVVSIITSRTDYESIVGDLTLNIGGTGEVGTVSFDAVHVDAAKNQVINLSGTGSLTSLSGSAWDSINVLANAEFDFLGTYDAAMTAALNVEDNAVLQLSAANNTTIPAYNKVGAQQTGTVVLATEHVIVAVEAKAAEEHVGGWNAHYRCSVCDKYFTDEIGINETTLEALTIPATGSLTHHDYDGNQDEGTHILDVTGGQGNAIYGNILVACTKYGECTMYDMLTGNEIASFNLGSYNKSTLTTDPDRVGDTTKGNWSNHSNQIMFGPAKFDESDPLPLLYVTTGNSGKHDGTGAYVAKMAIERIRYSAIKGWYAETVQIIEFNDVANIPDQDGNDYKNMNNNYNATDDVLTNMYDAETGKFLYVSGNGYDASAGYQKVGWGWPAWFVDSKPTADTEGKIYIKSARYRTTRAYEPYNKNTYGIDDYFDGGNAYIVTEFNMPALPTSISEADGYGATVTLYTKDIQDQFELEYTYGFTQGGTMYNGRIYYSYGNGKNADANSADYAKYVTNAIQVIDIASQKIIAKLDITGTNMGGAREPECCSIWNGELMLGMNGASSYEMYSLGYVAIDGEISEPSCTENSKTEILCSLCGKKLGERENEDTKLGHDLTAHEANAADCETAGNSAYWSCSECGKFFSDADATTEMEENSWIIPASHTYDNDCDSECNSCGEPRTAPHNLTHMEEKVPANCQETGYSEHWYCEDCECYFGDEDASYQLNPAWISYSGDHVRPEDSIPCAVVPCELCGADAYGDAPCDRGDAPECTDAPCINCGEICYGWGHNYNTGDEEIPLPLCQPGDCVYCGEHFDSLYECENGSYAPCSVDGECVFGCGKQYPATGEHDFGEGVTACEGGLCWMCWTDIEPQHEYTYECDAYCCNCGELTNPDAEHNLTHYEAVDPTCDEEGNIEYWRCEDCGAAYADEAATLPLGKDRWILDATGHSDTDLEYLVSDNGIHDVYCNACGDVIAEREPCTMEDHKCKFCGNAEWMSVIFMDGDTVFIEYGAAYGSPIAMAGMPIPEAPEGKEWAGWYTKDGVRVQHGMVVTSNLVAYATWQDIQDPTNPDTGDSFTALYSAVLGLAVIGMAVIVCKKKELF